MKGFELRLISALSAVLCLNFLKIVLFDTKFEELMRSYKFMTNLGVLAFIGIIAIFSIFCIFMTFFAEDDMF